MTKHLSKIVVFRDTKTQEEFHSWRKPARLTQMRVASFVTAFLYIIFSKLSSLVVPIEALSFVAIIHLYIIAPLLFSIGVLSFFKNFKIILLYYYLLPL